MRWPFSRTPDLSSGAQLYAAIVGEARRPEYYRTAGVADTMDGRFALLSTLLALTDISANRPSIVSLTPALR